ncbi:CDP-diacylglycerol--glycerol-3-phosphate 3-phosphatidyltransferase [Dokdonella immobilis]|uniref:CDP-diacylglycerol--glycerol-3-phosphate 3-phosphatidyltransferase n=1 Tax=Dokdonella immobilis TaxID=578942 RepID=A0A1I5AUK1_9GAMM|nr:CDP-diacylglycerol--glycerol-3-phosphate 3-phosphatidyltransferase [Dokdonella immobilis]SFN66123.1 CDP-diacylglycerol--glycerol-3-phosphate 3-phosphatidyltransferase [Dokdonella immobilis]
MHLTLPTILTLFRIALLPVIVIVFYLPEYFPATRSWSNLAAAGIFITAGITDWLDGWIARRYNMSSAFGAFLDPVADKLMVAVALFLIVQQNPSALMAVASAVIVGREISISALREWMAELGKRAAVGVAWVGKFKTVMQIVAIVVCLHQRDFPELRLYRIGEGLLVVAAALTIWSAIVYVRAAWPIMRDADSGKI